MPSHSLTNFEIQKYYQNKPKFNGFSSRKNLPETIDGTNGNNLDECKSMRTHEVALYVDDDHVTLIAFELNVSQKIEKFIKTKCRNKYV